VKPRGKWVCILLFRVGIEEVSRKTCRNRRGVKKNGRHNVTYDTFDKVNTFKIMSIAARLVGIFLGQFFLVPFNLESFKNKKNLCFVFPFVDQKFCTLQFFGSIYGTKTIL